MKEKQFLTHVTAGSRRSLDWLTLSATVLTAFGTQAAYAGDDYIVYSPRVTKGQTEVELRGFTYQGGGNLDGTVTHEISIAHAVTNWWKPELYIAEFTRNPGGPTHLTGYEFESFSSLRLRVNFGQIPDSCCPMVSTSSKALRTGSNSVRFWRNCRGELISGSI